MSLALWSRGGVVMRLLSIIINNLDKKPLFLWIYHRKNKWIIKSIPGDNA
jgi:hypothetical protein